MDEEKSKTKKSTKAAIVAVLAGIFIPFFALIIFFAMFYILGGIAFGFDNIGPSLFEFVTGIMSDLINSFVNEIL